MPPLVRVVRKQCPLLALIVLVFLGMGCSFPASTGRKAATTYSMSISLDSTLNQFAVVASLSSSHWTAGENLVLLSHRAEIDSISRVAGTSNQRIEWQRNAGDTLVLRPLEPSPDASGSAEITLIFAYRFPCDTAATGDILLRREDRWYPVLPDEPFQFQITSAAPGRFRSVSCGEFTAGVRDRGLNTGTWRMERPTYTMPIAFVDTTDISLVSTVDSGLQVDFYAHEAPDSTARAILRQCVMALRYYSHLLGPYPLSHLTLIEVPDFQAVQSLPGLMIVGGWAPKYFWHPGFGDWPAHEVAHQWVGNILLTNTLSVPPGRLFVEESLSEFLRVEFIRSEYGADSAGLVLAAYLKELNDNVPDASSRSLYNLKLETQADFKMAFRQGPLVWQRIKDQLGPDAWVKFLARIAHENWYRPLGYDGLRQTMTDVAPTGVATALMDSLVDYMVSPD